MFDFVRCAENTYYLKSFSNVGVYYLGNDEVILIDSTDHKKSLEDLDKELSQRGWRVKMIINTHSHIDHITGNRFFYDKFGCEIYASEIEALLIEEPNIEGTFFFSGSSVRGFIGNGIKSEKGVPTKVLQKDSLPEGFETISLPGHNFNMIGVKTPDGVWFLGDSILMKETFDSYKIPFFLNVNESIKTAKMLAELKGNLFVPSHVPQSEDISALALYNAEKLEEIKEYIFSICDGRSLEEILEKADTDLKLNFNADKYSKISISTRSHLQALLEDKRITASIERSRLVYRHC